MSATAFVGQHFAFAAGRTAILKQHLLSQSDVDRLLGSHGLAEFERTLRELKLMANVSAGTEGVDSLLNAAEQWVKREVEAMTPPAKRPTFGILWLTGDAPRLAYLLKKYHGLSSEVSTEPVTSLTLWNPVSLRAAVEGSVPPNTLPETLTSFIASMKILTKPSPWTIDRAVARFIAERRTALAHASGSADILQYVRHSIDVTNIRTALRLKTIGTPHAEEALLPGGSVPLTRLAGPKADIRSAIAGSDLYAPFIPAQGSAAPIAVEQIGASILAADIGRMWTVPLTVEPVFAFAAMVMAHVRLLRAIAIGKRNKLSPQEIKQILPPFIPSTHFPA
ncbi:MAG: V-type ATPase subunit [Candidatus Peribacteraceae bacterium]|nr:V-type ATPase subunit [Candidatus Peribacteraceae bacterium]